MSDLHSLPVAPDPAFEARLEQLMLADLGWVPSPSRSAPSATPTVVGVRRRRRVGIALSAALVAAAAVLIALVVSGDEERVPVTTVTPSTVVPTTPPTVPPTTVAPTTVAPTTVPPSTTPTTTTATTAAPGAEQLRPGTPLVAGSRYRVGENVVGRAFSFTNAVDGALAGTTIGIFGLASDANDDVGLLAVADLAAAAVFVDPLADWNAWQTNAEVQAATTAAPEDYLAYFASLPGVDAGPVESTTFAGYPARSLRYTIGPITGGYDCTADGRGHCLLALWSRGLQLAFTYWEGDAGTFYEFTLGDRTVLVGVADRPGAAETAASIVFET